MTFRPLPHLFPHPRPPCPSNSPSAKPVQEQISPSNDLMQDKTPNAVDVGAPTELTRALARDSKASHPPISPLESFINVHIGSLVARLIESANLARRWFSHWPASHPHPTSCVTLVSENDGGPLVYTKPRDDWFYDFSESKGEVRRSMARVRQRRI